MNKKHILILLMIFSFASVNAQSLADSTRIMGYLPIYHADETKWLQRYQKDIDNYTKENSRMTDFSCDALFLGSSSINLWKNIYNDMAPLKIIRRSYGGSTIRDMIYNYNTIARGYNPKKIVLYVENDFGSWKEAISPGECYDLFRLFEQMIHRDYPTTPLYIISFKPSFSKSDQLKDQLVINSLLEDYAKRTKYVEYIDITKDMYDKDGKLREDIFVEDRLHINQKGYDLWTKAIKPLLMQNN